MIGSSWMNLGLDEVDLGCGTPVRIAPPVREKVHFPAFGVLPPCKGRGGAIVFSIVKEEHADAFLQLAKTPWWRMSQGNCLRRTARYAMMAENLPPWARKELDSICRKFFWAGSDQSVRGKCMVAWNTCRRPTRLGGLGISDLQLAGYALQTRWLWLQRADHARAWSELPIKTAKEVRAFFKASTYT
jgi:hypothetical protein